VPHPRRHTDDVPRDQRRHIGTKEKLQRALSNDEYLVDVVVRVRPESDVGLTRGEFVSETETIRPQKPI
jgi:hypothetical protein